MVQRSAPPPEAVTLQADQRTNNKVDSFTGFIPAIPSGADITRYDEFIPSYPASFLKRKKQGLLFENFLNVIRFFSFGGEKDPMIKTVSVVA